jgi:hypothetical protein
MSESKLIKPDVLHALLFSSDESVCAIPVKHINGEVTHGVYLVPKEHFEKFDLAMNSEPIHLDYSDFE